MPTTLHSPLSSLQPGPSINQTKQAHAQIIVFSLTANASFTSHLLAFLALSPSTPFAYSLSIYQTIQCPSLFASNNMIQCLAKREFSRESVVLYSSILGRNLIPNNHTYTFLLQACSKALAICEGTQVHNPVVKLDFCEDVFIRNALIHLYSACCREECLKWVFEENGHCRDVVTWNSMLVGFVRDGRIGDAEKVFDEMPKRNVISWSTMIMGYVLNGQLEEGLECFKEMREKGLRPYWSWCY